MTERCEFRTVHAKSSLQNCTVAVVGEGMDMAIHDDEKTQPFLALIEGEERSRGARRDAQPAQPQEPADQPDPSVAEPQVDQGESMDQS